MATAILGCEEDKCGRATSMIETIHDYGLMDTGWLQDARRICRISRCSVHNWPIGTVRVFNMASISWRPRRAFMVKVPSQRETTWVIGNACTHEGTRTGSMSIHISRLNEQDQELFGI